jgi:hypothetical protein
MSPVDEVPLAGCSGWLVGIPVRLSTSSATSGGLMTTASIAARPSPATVKID